MMNAKNNYDLSSKLLLPYLETNNECFKDIFHTLIYNYGLKIGSKQKFIDLGSGEGRVVIYCALHYHIESQGIELDKNVFLQTKRYLKNLKKTKNIEKKSLRKIKLKQGDLFEQNLITFDFVYIYSFPPMHQYLRHVLKTAKKGAIIIAHRYELKSFTDLLSLKKTITFKGSKASNSTFFYEKT